MRKAIFVLLILMVIFPLVSAKDIAYIVKDTNQKLEVTNAITELGYTYDIIKDTQIPATNFANYKVIIVGDGNFGSYLPGIPVNNKTSLVMNLNHIAYWHWTTDGPSSIASSQPLRAQVINNQSTITNGIPAIFQVYTQAKAPNGQSIPLYFLSKEKRAVKMNNMVAPMTDKLDSTVSTTAKGMALKDGVTSKARGAFFGATETEYWTADTKQLLENTLTWLVEDEDKDHDGYKSDVDCNDTNAGIHPGAIEIPYDHIDQNCDGYDLADVDHDGYCKAGYVIENKALQCPKENGTVGTDCNDNDASVNLGSLDPKKDCKNSAPVLSIPIPTIEWNEDGNTTKDLNLYFSDPDGDPLIYSVNQTSENQNVTIEYLGNGKMKFTSSQYWSGEDWVIFKAQDSGGLYVLSNNVTLKVDHINHAPVLDNIPNIMVVEGQKIEIIANAFDVEGDNITYSMDSNKFTQDGNKFTWQTQIGDAKQYTVTVKATDSNGAFSTKTFKIFVVEKIYINEFVSNPKDSEKEWVEIYNPGKNSFNLNSCSLNDGTGHTLTLTGSVVSKGFVVGEFSSNVLNNDGDLIELKCLNQTLDQVAYGNYDNGQGIENNAPAPGQGQSSGRDPDGKDTGSDKNDFRIFDHPTKGLPSNADVIPPVVTLLSPENRKSVNDTNDVSLEWSATDNIATKIQCSIYVNTALKGTKTINNGDTGNFTLMNLLNGNYLWNVKCSDGYNSALASQDWSFNLNAPASPVLESIGDKTVNEGDNLEFTIHSTNPNNNRLTFSIGNQPLGANFVNNGDGSAVFSWTPNFNQSGVYNVVFNVKDENNLKDSETIKMTVNDVKEPPKFNNVPQCTDRSNMIGLKVTSPSNGKNYKVGEKIKGNVQIKNDFSDSDNFDVKVHLYDIKNDESVDDYSDSVDVNGGSSKTLSFDLKIPSDAEDGRYAIYAYAEDGNGRCNTNFSNVDVQRNNNDVIIKNLVISPQTANPGDNIEASVKVQNIGGDDQDVYIQVENPELNILQKTDIFTLESYGNDDTKTKVFYINIPKNVEAKDYEITATVYFSDTEATQTGTLSILSKTSSNAPYLATNNPETILISGTPTTNYGNPIKIETNAYKKPVENKEVSNKKPAPTTGQTETNMVFPGLTTNDILLIVDVLLIIGILIEIVMIRIVTRR